MAETEVNKAPEIVCDGDLCKVSKEYFEALDRECCDTESNPSSKGPIGQRPAA